MLKSTTQKLKLLNKIAAHQQIIEDAIRIEHEKTDQLIKSFNIVIEGLEKIMALKDKELQLLKPRNTVLIAENGRAYILNSLKYFYFDFDFNEREGSFIFLLKCDPNITIDTYKIDISKATEFIAKNNQFDQIDKDSWNYALILLKKKERPNIRTMIGGESTVGLMYTLEQHTVLFKGQIHNLCLRSIIEAIKPIYKKEQKPVEENSKIMDAIEDGKIAGTIGESKKENHETVVNAPENADTNEV